MASWYETHIGSHLVVLTDKSYKKPRLIVGGILATGLAIVAALNWNKNPDNKLK